MRPKKNLFKFHKKKASILTSYFQPVDGKVCHMLISKFKIIPSKLLILMNKNIIFICLNDIHDWWKLQNLIQTLQIKLVEGQSLYIDSVKIAILKRKCKKNERKSLKALLDYYFTPKCPAMHSATGEKSTKPGLPVIV